MSTRAGFLVHEPNPIPCVTYAPQNTSPVGTLLFLHGMGECGTNATLPLTTGLPLWLMKQPERWPFVVVIPQKPRFELPWHDYQEAVLAHLDEVVRERGLDPTRVGITGLSQGGNGALRIGSACSSRFRAVASVCGFARFFPTEPEADEPTIMRGVVAGLADSPVRLFHGADDPVIPVAMSERVETALLEAGATVSLETYAGVGHDCWDKAYGTSDLPEWFGSIFQRG